MTATSNNASNDDSWFYVKCERKALWNGDDVHHITEQQSNKAVCPPTVLRNISWLEKRGKDPAGRSQLRVAKTFVTILTVDVCRMGSFP